MKFKQKIMTSVLALGLVTSSMFVSNANTIEREVESNTIQLKSIISKWVQSNGYWYYYKNGVKQKGWIQDSGKWYYLNSSGIMQAGWVQLGGQWYYLRSSGVMAIGWEQVGNKWYYLNNSGVMQAGWVQLGGQWYYLRSSGVMAIGWEQVGNKWYYLNNSGAMQSGWEQIQGKWYYFYGSGVMATNTTIDGWKLDGSGVGTYIGNNSNNGLALNKAILMKDWDGGNYEVTFERVRLTDERNPYSDIKPTKVFFLDYNYKNINCEEDVYAIEGIEFKVADGEGNMLSTYPVMDYSRVQQPCPAGMKSVASEAFAITSNSNNITIFVYNKVTDKVIGKINVSL